MKLSLLLATSFLTAGIVFSHPMDMDDGNLEFSDVSRFISIANAPGPVAPPVVIPVDGTIKDLPNLGEKQLNIAEIARLDNKILSIPRAEGEEPLFLVIHDAKRYTHHYEDDEQNNTQVEGITFKFSLAMVDPRRVEKQFWDDVLDALSDEPDMPAAVDHKIHDPSSTWSHPLKSCFSAGWQPNKTLFLFTWSPVECAPALNEQVLSNLLDDIAGRLGALQIFHMDRQTIQVNFNPAGGDCHNKEECAITIRTPLWNLIMNGREDPSPLTTSLTPFGFQLDAPHEYYEAKQALLNTRAVDLLDSFSSDPSKRAVSTIKGVLSKHAEYLETHSVVDLIRQLATTEGGEDTRLLLKYLFGIPWERMQRAYGSEHSYFKLNKGPFFNAIIVFQRYTPLTKTLI